MKEAQYGTSYLTFKKVFFGQCNSILRDNNKPDERNKCILYLEHEGSHVYEIQPRHGVEQ